MYRITNVTKRNPFIKGVEDVTIKEGETELVIRPRKIVVIEDKTVECYNDMITTTWDTKEWTEDTKLYVSNVEKTGDETPEKEKEPEKGTGKPATDTGLPEKEPEDTPSGTDNDIPPVKDEGGNETHIPKEYLPENYTKKELITWLQKYEIPYNGRSSKTDLIELLVGKPELDKEIVVE